MKNEENIEFHPTSPSKVLIDPISSVSAQSMNSDEFRKAAHSAIEEGRYILHRKLFCELICQTVIEYYETIENRPVVSNVTPGYLREILPAGPPQEGEEWSAIQRDIEDKIMPGLTHWYGQW